MYGVDLYRRVRLACHREGLSRREASRQFGIDRKTVAKILLHAEPPGYRRRQPPKRPKLAPFTDIIDGILEEDRTVHRKQRHTAKRIFERLRDEHGFTGKQTIVKDYVRERHLGLREMFVPLAHPPGHAQADFGEADAIIAGVMHRAHFFVMTLPHSDACFVAACPAAAAEAWLDGHNAAFAFFGGVPQSILYDNDKCLVPRILPDGTRQRTRSFSGLQSHYLFEDRYGRPGKGNDKGNVEGVVGYARRNFMVPRPRFASWDTFNAQLEEQCRNRQGEAVRGHRETIGERLRRDCEALMVLPPAPFDACDRQGTNGTTRNTAYRITENGPVLRRPLDLFCSAVDSWPTNSTIRSRLALSRTSVLYATVANDRWLLKRVPLGPRAAVIPAPGERQPRVTADADGVVHDRRRDRPGQRSSIKTAGRYPVSTRPHRPFGRMGKD